MNLFKTFVNINIVASRWVDGKLFYFWQTLGWQDFRDKFAWQYSLCDRKIYDVGGGKMPFFTLEQRKALGGSVVGVDISEKELRKAPIGSYDDVIPTDICTYAGPGDADIVVCQALFEHLRNVQSAVNSIASILKPGGVLLLYVPCRNAIFARLNLALPQRLKQRLLYSVFKHAAHTSGFPAYYDHCTPKKIISLAKECGFEVESIKRYYISTYFTFFLPLHLSWRIMELMMFLLMRGEACEAFSIALTLRRPQEQVRHRPEKLEL